MENLSLSDIASVTKGNGFGGDGMGFFWIFALLLLAGGGFGGFGGGSNALTQQDMLINSNYENLARNVQSISDRQYEQANNLTKGICELGYTTAQNINNTQTVLGTAITSEGRSVQAQLAEVNANTTAQTQKILDALAQNKIESLQAEVSELKTQNMFCGIPRINPYGYGVYPYNNCSCSNF